MLFFVVVVVVGGHTPCLTAVGRSLVTWGGSINGNELNRLSPYATSEGATQSFLEGM